MCYILIQLAHVLCFRGDSKVVRNTCAILVGYMLAGTAVTYTLYIYNYTSGWSNFEANVMIADLCDGLICIYMY